MNLGLFPLRPTSGGLSALWKAHAAVVFCLVKKVKWAWKKITDTPRNRHSPGLRNTGNNKIFRGGGNSSIFHVSPWICGVSWSNLTCAYFPDGVGSTTNLKKIPRNDVETETIIWTEPSFFGPVGRCYPTILMTAGLPNGLNGLPLFKVTQNFWLTNETTGTWAEHNGYGLLEF